VRHVAIQRQSLAYAFTQGGGAEVEAPAGATVPAQPGEVGRGAKGKTGALQHDELDQVCERAGLTPLGKFGELVGTDDPVEGCGGVNRAKMAGALDGVVHTASCDLVIGDGEPGQVLDGESQHRKPICRRGARRMLL